MRERTIGKGLGLVESPRSINYGNPTLLVLGGLGSINSSGFMLYLEGLFSSDGHRGEDLNLVRLSYPSHVKEKMSGFNSDVDAVGESILELRRLGFNEKKIGLAGACYGSYVGARFLEGDKDKLAKFGVFAVPYFGPSCLKFPVYPIAKALAFLDKGVNVSEVVPFYRSNKTRIKFNLAQLVDFMSKEVDLGKLDVPVSVFYLPVHRFLKNPKLPQNVRAFNVLETASLERRREIVKDALSFMDRL